MAKELTKLGHHETFAETSLCGFGGM